MTGDDPRWWLNLPPCPDCGRSHVLADCAERLPQETGKAAEQAEAA
jgi:ribosomal protein S27AE